MLAFEIGRRGRKAVRGAPFGVTIDNRKCSMRSRLVNPSGHLSLIRSAFAAAMILLFSGWTSCNGMFAFNSCQDGVLPQPQIVSLSPGTMPADAESVELVVGGSGFVSGSQIMWNENPLQTTFVDSRHLQTTITQQTFDSFGGSAGSTVQISVKSQSAAELGCPIGGNSSTLTLIIN
jgi:hypothetical protein